MRRGSTSRSQTSAGSARPWSGTSTSRRRSTPAPPRAAWRSTPCQDGSERRQRALVGGLDLLAQRRPARRGAGGAARRGRTTRARCRPGRSSPRTSAPGALELAQRSRRVGVDAVALAQLLGRERAVRARVARDELVSASGDVGEERLRQAAGRHGAERVAVQPGVVGGDPALLAADAQPDRAPLALELGEQRLRRSRLVSTRSAYLARREVADAPQHVGELVARRRPGALGAVLEVVVDGVERVGVDQLAQLLLPEQLAQQVAVERQRGGAALGVRRVALVHVRRDVVEQQRGGERRGGRRLDLDERDLARCSCVSRSRRGRAGRARRAGTRGRSRGRSGSRRSAWRPRAGSATSAAAATAACACPGRRAGSAARGRRSRGSARRTARWRRARPTTRSSTSSGSMQHEVSARGPRRRRAGAR